MTNGDLARITPHKGWSGVDATKGWNVASEARGGLPARSIRSPFRYDPRCAIMLTAVLARAVCKLRGSCGNSVARDQALYSCRQAGAGGAPTSCGQPNATTTLPPSRGQSFGSRNRPIRLLSYSRFQACLASACHIKSQGKTPRTSTYITPSL